MDNYTMDNYTLDDLTNELFTIPLIQDGGSASVNSKIFSAILPSSNYVIIRLIPSNIAL